jgi:hypothetical protein
VVEEGEHGLRGCSSGPELVWRLGDAPYDADEGRVGVMNLLFRSGLPVSGGVVLTHDLHRAYLTTSGLGRDLLAARGEPGEAVRALRRKYGGRAPTEELGRVIRGALIELGGRTVAVVSEDVNRTGLRSIPRVQAAVVDAWLSKKGLRRQVEAAARREEIPTWPVLIQREIHDG